jgi:2-haloacid dehalogenase
MKLPYELLLFDLDDTLLDFSLSEHISLTKLHQEFYSRVPYLEFATQFHSINKKLWERVGVAANPLEPGHIRLLRFLELNASLQSDHKHEVVAYAYEKFLGENATWLPDVKAAIDFLHKKGYVLGIITNGLMSVQYKKYELNQLSNWFDCFIVSDKVKTVKPHNAIFEIAFSEIVSQGKLERINLNKVLMIGDSLTADGCGSKNVGVDYCFIGQAELEHIKQQHDIDIKYHLSSVRDLPNCLGHENEYAAYLSNSR